jgi:NADP-dependent 3-hydroxy acid dehydrogenase YdfG
MKALTRQLLNDFQRDFPLSPEPFESVARELHGTGLNITVGLVCPGVCDTPLTNPKGEPRPDHLRPETVAAAVLHAVTAPENINVFDTTLFSTCQKPW